MRQIPVPGKPSKSTSPPRLASPSFKQALTTLDVKAIGSPGDGQKLMASKSQVKIQILPPGGASVNVYSVGQTLHPHLGLNITKSEKKVNPGKETEWQLKGITQRFKKDQELKQKVVAMNSPQHKLQTLGRASYTSIHIKNSASPFEPSLSNPGEQLNLSNRKSSPTKKIVHSKSSQSFKFGAPVPKIKNPSPPRRMFSGDTVPNLQTQNMRMQQLMNDTKKTSYFNMRDTTNNGLNNYIMQGKSLGEGAFATVRIALQSSTGMHVAIKTYNKLKIVDSGTMKSIEREAMLLSRINSQFVVKFIEKIENTRNIHVVMECAGKHNLEEYLKEKKEGAHLKPHEIMTLLGNITRGLQAIHVQNIIHRDLKIENVVLNHYDHPKIVDFGFARELETQMGVCGTLNYMSPELCEKVPQKKQTDKADVWALGVIFFFVLTHRHPFHGNNEFEIKKCIMESEPDYKGIEEPELSLVMSMLLKNPDERPSCSKILEHAYFKDLPHPKEPIVAAAPTVPNPGPQ